MVAAPVSAAPNHKIWQTWREAVPSMTEVNEDRVRSWTELNPGYRYELLTDGAAEDYVRSRLPHRPDIVATYLSLTDPILRADLIRYIVLLLDGGVYTDVDTAARKPIADWIPEHLRNGTRLAVGIEVDEWGTGFMWGDQWLLPWQFCQWTLYADAGHAAMEKMIDSIIDDLQDLSIEQGQPLSSLHLSAFQVLNVTGPNAYTRVILDDMSAQTSTNVTWANVTRITEPTLIGDILVLPINAFGSGQHHSNSGGLDGGDVLATHYFQGSWKGEHDFE